MEVASQALPESPFLAICSMEGGLKQIGDGARRLACENAGRGPTEGQIKQAEQNLPYTHHQCGIRTSPFNGRSSNRAND